MNNIHTRSPKHTILANLKELRVKLAQEEHRETEDLSRKELLGEALDDTKRHIKSVRQGTPYKVLK